MAIRPVDIRRKEFKSSLRGYDANQVDDFLDIVADEFERVFSENQRMGDEMKNLNERLKQFEELEASIREALVHAQQVAGDLRQNANKEAELILREAKEQSHRILADSSSRVERVQESYEVLRRAKQDFANDFRHLLKSFLEVMDNVDIASAKEIEASLRDRLDLESVAVAHEAAETRRLEADSEGYGDEEKTVGATSSAESGEASDAATGPPTRGPGLEPDEQEEIVETEVEEPEVEPSSVEKPPPEVPETAPSRPEVEEEVEREGTMPAGEGRAYDEFFQEREGTEERQRFRAGRFLRRRG